MILSKLPKKDVKVLVIEDNFINQKVMQLLLGEIGIAHDIVENGMSAIKAINKNKYDALLVDVGLPDISGYEVIAKVRARRDKKSRVPVIVLSADARLDSEKTLQKKGVDIYLSKPLTLDSVRDALASFFEL